MTHGRQPLPRPATGDECLEIDLSAHLDDIGRKVVRMLLVGVDVVQHETDIGVEVPVQAGG